MFRILSRTVTTALTGKCIGERMGLSIGEIDDIFLAAKLHDLIDLFCEHYDDILAYITVHSRGIIDKYENLQTEYRYYLKKYSDLNHEIGSIGGFTIGSTKATLK